MVPRLAFKQKLDSQNQSDQFNSKQGNKCVSHSNLSVVAEKMPLSF